MKYIGIDVGATKTIGLEINSITGEIETELFRFPNSTIGNNSELTQKLYEKISPLGSSNDIMIGAAVAGVINGLIVESCANLRNIREPLTFARDLKDKGFKRVVLLNDMQGATMGEAIFGNGKGYDDIAVATYSSGYNYSVAHKGKLIERIIEAGHQSYKPGSGVFCGCSGEGHLETFVSGNGAASMARQALMMQGIPFHTILEEVVKSQYKIPDKHIKILKENFNARLTKLMEITSKQVYSALREKPNENPQATIQMIQSDAIAYSFGQMISNHSPLDIICCMGSQTNDWDILFEPAIEKYHQVPANFQHPSLKTPKIVRCSDIDIVAKGAVAYLLQETA
jgi:hypothetical protein